MDKTELIEQLAREEHRSWADWMNYVFDVGKTNEDGSFTIPTEYVQGWLRQCCTAYKILSEREKQMDREEVKRILPIIEAYKDEQLKEAIDLLKEWKEFAYNAVPSGHVHFDFLGRKGMTEKTDRFLEKEGMKE